MRVVEILGRSGEAPWMNALVESFAAGLAAFDAEDWREAVKRFRAVLDDYPDDGPTEYFVKLADIYSLEPPLPGRARPMRMNAK